MTFFHDNRLLSMAHRCGLSSKKNSKLFPNLHNPRIKIFCINRLVFKKMGEDVTDEELEQIVHLADRDGDGKIGWEDFLAVMLDNK